MTLAVEQDLRDDARGDLLGESFDDGGLADAGLADAAPGCSWCGGRGSGRRGRISSLAADDRVEFARLGQFGEVATEGLEQREAFAAAGAGALLAGGAPREAGRLRKIPRKPGCRRPSSSDSSAAEGSMSARISLRQRSRSTSRLLQHAGGDALPFLQEAEEDVFGADVGVAEGAGFGDGVGQSPSARGA
jgi:hypothetical protein